MACTVIAALRGLVAAQQALLAWDARLGRVQKAVSQQNLRERKDLLLRAGLLRQMPKQPLHDDPSCYQ